METNGEEKCTFAAKCTTVFEAEAKTKNCSAKLAFSPAQISPKGTLLRIRFAPVLRILYGTRNNSHQYELQGYVSVRTLESH